MTDEHVPPTDAELVCIRCLQRKPMSEYYKDKRMDNGHRSDCKSCCKQYRATNQVRINTNDRKRRLKDRDKVNAQARSYQHANYEKKAAAKKKSIAKHPEKEAARLKLRQAVRRGNITKPTQCQHCNHHSPEWRIDGHHEDYSKPLDVMWLCVPCHRQQHKKVRK